jgi:hypothetical protein
LIGSFCYPYKSGVIDCSLEKEEVKTINPKDIKLKRRGGIMRKYGKKAQEEVRKTMKKYKEGKLRSGRSHKKVSSRKQAIAIGLSKAREEGAKVPKKS